MSGLELAGFILGVLGPLEQSITLVNLLHNHLKSVQSNEDVIKQLISSLSQLQSHLHQLEKQLQQYNQSIPNNNYQIFKTHLIQMQNTFNTIHRSLTNMEQSAKRRLFRFRKATKWAEQCESMQSKINDAHHKILQINSFLGQTSVVTSTVKESERNLIQVIATNEASSSTDQSRDRFKPYFQKLPVSNAAITNFDSLDSHGNPLTTEGKVKKQLLTHLRTYQTKIFAIHGPGGVGKTTCMHMLSHENEIRQHFTHGIYCVKLGADAKAETAINQMANIMRHSGGLIKAREIESMKSLDEVICLASDWFSDKKILLLVDDVWEREKIGSRFITLLKQIMCGSDKGGIVFTTRDPAIATEALQAFVLNCRDPEGEESRAILFQHARQNSEASYGAAAEGAIKSLLKTCAGLPVAHSVVGKGVLQYSLRRSVGHENAWQIYARRQMNILKGRADDYDYLYSVFEAAISVLEEDEIDIDDKGTDSSIYCYGEVHRSLSVLERQQWAPLEILGCMWNVQSEDTVRKICENLVRAGLAEWHHEEITSGEGVGIDIEGISIHDLLHNFATAEAQRQNEVQIWHKRIVDGYANRKHVTKMNVNGCREWWTIAAWDEDKDGGYFMRNICRHMRLAEYDENEVAILVTRPEWIKLQLCKNGILQYETDVKYGCESIERMGQDGRVGMKELEIIRDATRLSASYILKNSDEVWFQLYGRLMRYGNMFDWVKRYLQYIEDNAPLPWLRPIGRSDGLLTSVGSGARGLVNVGDEIWSTVILSGDEEIVCGCDEGKLAIVNLKENIVKVCWVGHTEDITAMTTVQGGKFVVTVSHDGLGKVWEVESLRRVMTLKGHSGSVRGVQMSKDEKLMYTSGSDETIRIWDFASGKCIRILQTDIPFRILFAVFVVNNQECVVVRDGRNLQVWKIEIESGMGQDCKDEKLNENHNVREIEMHSDVDCIALTEDDSKMVTGHRDGTIQLWDARSISPIEELWNAHTDQVKCIAFNKDGTRFVSGCYDGTIQVREVSTGDLLSQLWIGSGGDTLSVNFMQQDDNILWYTVDGTVRVWNIDQPSEVEDDESEDVQCVKCSPDESCFITGHIDGSLRVWDIGTRQMIRKSSPIHDKWIWDVAVTQDRRWIVSAGEDATVRVSDWETLGLIHTFEGHKEPVMHVEISGSQEFAVTGSLDRTIRIWDLKKCDGSHEIIESDDWRWLYRCYISSDEQRILVPARDDYDNYSVVVWNIERRQLMGEYEHSQARYLLREEIMSLAGEPEVGREFTSDRAFIRLYKHDTIWQCLAFNCAGYR